MATELSENIEASPTAETVAKKPAKKTAKKVAKKAAKKTAKKAAPASSPSAAKGRLLTTIFADVDIGWGNGLFIRGEGAGLQWDVGQKLEWSSKGWSWSGLVAKGSQIEFKILLNDANWANGDNIVVKSGETCRISPEF